MKSILRVMTLGALVWLTMPAGDGFGQAYPTKAVSMVVPFPPGGRTDLTARVVAQ